MESTKLSLESNEYPAISRAIPTVIFISCFFKADARLEKTIDGENSASSPDEK
jgi:hypothetical protein